MKHKKGKLTSHLMSLSLIPLLCYGCIVILMLSFVIYASLRDEIRESLDILIHASYETFELQYPGDYTETDADLYKGKQCLAQCFDLVDDMKRISGADVTLFYGDTRYLTTIVNEQGMRAVGTKAQAEVVDRVLSQGQEYFSDRVLVHGTLYFGYYMPLANAEQRIIGMIFVGKPRDTVLHKVLHNIMIAGALAIGIMAIALAVSFYYSKNMIRSLNQTKKFLGQIACGDLTAQLDAHLLKRQDEIGEMGQFAVMLQQSITSLVGADPLTGLSNRRSCDVVLDSLLAKNQGKRYPFCLVMCDIDHFKQVNDTYGHPIGDEVLKAVSQCFSAHMKHLGFVFRWGGEEFLLIYEDTNRQAVYAHLHRLQASLAAVSVPCPQGNVTVTLTFGIADNTEGNHRDMLIAIADSNLYRGKQQGRNCIICSMQ